MRALKALKRKFAKTKPAKSIEARRELLAIDGEPVAVNVRLNPRSRRIVMRVHPVTGEVTVTAPTRGGMAQALSFARGEAEWIARQRGAVPAAIVFAAGSIVPFSGVPYRICRGTESGPVPVWRDEITRQIFVSGRAEHVQRRLLDFFKREARKSFEIRAMEYGKALGVTPSRITVRDTASRWGSCSSARSLSFSWRLIFAPAFVRDYVVAHEVAHLKEMNHGPDFWAHVHTLNADQKKARKWLREHGRGLLRYN